MLISPAKKFDWLTSQKQWSLDQSFARLWSVVYWLGLAGCSQVQGLTGKTEKTEEEVAAAPTFVDFESLTFNLGSFPTTSYRPGTPLTNHIRAYLFVADVQLMLETHLGVAAESIKAATSAPATKWDGEDVWTYSHSFTYDSANYAGELSSTKGEGATGWSASISKEPVDEFGCCDGFEWYVGSNSSVSEGDWTINNFLQPAEVAAIGQVTWLMTALDNKKLVYTIKAVNPAFSEYLADGTIKLTIDGQENILEVIKDSTAKGVVIRWNSKDKNGSYEDLDREELVCWDGDLANVNCP
jgi:hypothetical protein